MTVSRRVKIYQIVLETILVIAMSFIIGLFMWSIVSGGPDHRTLQREIASIRQQVAVLTCEIHAQTEADRAECAAIDVEGS